MVYLALDINCTPEGRIKRAQMLQRQVPTMGFSVIGFGGRLLLINDPVSTGNNWPGLNDLGELTHGRKKGGGFRLPSRCVTAWPRRSCYCALASFRCFSRCSRRMALRERRILLPSMAKTFTSTWSPSFSSSRTSRMRCSAISLMCSNPSVPGKSSTKAPKSASRTTLPRYVLPTSSVGSEDVHFAIVHDVDLHAGGLDDGANLFSARADQIANLVGGNGQLE